MKVRKCKSKRTKIINFSILPDASRDFQQSLSSTEDPACLDMARLREDAKASFINNNNSKEEDSLGDYTRNNNNGSTSSSTMSSRVSTPAPASDDLHGPQASSAPATTHQMELVAFTQPENCDHCEKSLTGKQGAQ